MNWLQFFASVIGSIAWPTTVLIVLLIVIRNIGSLSRFIERLKYKDFEVEFRRSVQELTERSRSVLPNQDADEQAATPRDRLYSLAEISPRSAILEAWLQVEAAAVEALLSKDPTLAGKAFGMAPLRLGEQLNRRQIINGPQLALFQRLRELRNKAVHVGDSVFQLDEVAEYIALASSLASQIKRGSYVD